MYCRVDVFQLADIMEYQRERLMGTHGLDIIRSFTLPGFSWRAALKFTGQKLELITDGEMYDFIQEAKRGGISTITHRYVKPSNQYIGKIRGKTPKEIMKGFPNRSATVTKALKNKVRKDRVRNAEIMGELRQRTKKERQFSVGMVCEYFPNFSPKEI